MGLVTVSPIPVERLRPASDPSALTFATTDDLEPLEGTFGHERALEALRVGLGIRREGYNIFVVGSPGVGKHTVVIDTLSRRAKTEPVPPDICYVMNFDESHKPRVLKLAPGEGGKLKAAMNRFVEDLRATLPVVFASEGYTERSHAIQEAMEKVHDQALDAVKHRATERGLAFVKTEEGFTFLPAKDGQVVDSEQFDHLPVDEKRRFEDMLEETETELQAVFGGVPRWRKETRDRLKALEKETVEGELVRLMEPLIQSYKDVPEVSEFLAAVRKDIPEQVHLFREDEPPEDDEGGEDALAMERARVAAKKAEIRRYAVNVLVDHAKSQGAPVITEDIPAFANLIGRIEHLSEFGALVTDHTLIKPGAFHLANGGYLVLDAWRLVNSPFAWSALKRVLRSRLVRMDNPNDQTHPMTTVMLTPDPIPVDVKVVIMGPAELYYELVDQDPELERHFKILAAFEERLPRTVDTTRLFARLIATKVKDKGLRPFDRDAVAAVIEEAARNVEDNAYLSTNLSILFNLLDESEFWAAEAGHAIVGRDDVARALAAYDRRASQPRDQIYEAVARGSVLVRIDGAVVGQINALGVVSLGNFEFGRVARISATARLGRGEVIDIERESDLAGSAHSKGMLILQSLLGSRYAPDVPLELSASLTFEQSYGYVDGDSASLAEFAALLSAIARVPIRQSIAVTGSINQQGEVQAIGGVNAKVEGFFATCQVLAAQHAGPTAVIIPRANEKNLMLSPEVVEAARAGRFAVYAVGTVEEALELLMGLPVGERDAATGQFPPDTLNARVEARLLELHELRRRARAQPTPG